MKNIVAMVLTSVCALLVVVLTGCVESRVVTADQVAYGEGDALTLYLRDGRRITLSPGDYTIRRDSVEEIKGTGRVLGRSLNDLGSAWKGTVRLSEIDSVRTDRDSAVARASGITVQALTAGFGVLMLVAWLAVRDMHH